MPVDRHLIAGRQHDRGDGVVVLQAGHPRGGVARPSVRVRERQLVVAAVERGSSGEVRQAVGEDDRCAQGHDRQRRSEQCGAHRDRGGAASALQGVTDSDHRARRRARGGHLCHDGGWVHSLMPGRRRRAPARRARRPDAQEQNHHHGCQRSEQENQRIEGKTSRRLGQARLADRSQGGQGKGDDDGAGRADERHHQIPRRAEHHELAPGQAQGHQSGVLLALDDALPTERLADDGKADQCGQDGEHPPAHGLGVDRCRHRRGSGGLI